MSNAVSFGDKNYGFKFKSIDWFMHQHSVDFESGLDVFKNFIIPLCSELIAGSLTVSLS